MNKWITGLLTAAVAAVLSGCGSLRADVPETIVIPKRVELGSDGSSALNYTPWYIHMFSISGPRGSGIGGGGPNVMPAKEDGRPSGGGAESCCTSYPQEWQPDLKLTVRWLAFKDVKRLGAKAPGSWYKAENVRWPPYDGRQSGVAWTIFLPGDRVKIVIANPDAHDLAPGAGPPASTDPYVAQGVVDQEWNEKYPNGVLRGLE
ncbi:MAG TPA: DUF3304 domain-containing protein [Trinickia sp.]|nr:DUF3304 domain-containing protein [Trinickia sp.]